MIELRIFFINDYSSNTTDVPGAIQPELKLVMLENLQSKLDIRHLNLLWKYIEVHLFIYLLIAIIKSCCK